MHNYYIYNTGSKCRVSIIGMPYRPSFAEPYLVNHMKDFPFFFFFLGPFLFWSNIYFSEVVCSYQNSRLRSQLKVMGLSHEFCDLSISQRLEGFSLNYGQTFISVI